ncbi:MAG: chemotaxis protein CheD [Leptospiraceae bacterium]|nr:chemotaxis protein CheD [Leptospiraceae bacterium]
MTTPDFIIEIFLQPAEFYWGDSDTRIKTLLGSCVAICIWHPKLKIGGMSHCLLPSRMNDMKPPSELSGRYIDEAMELFINEISKAGVKTQEFNVKLFGGGDMFKDIWKASGQTVGQRNIEMAHQMIAKYGMKILAENVGGQGHRNIIFDLWSGDVWMRQGIPGGVKK